MKTYSVTIPFAGHAIVVVEAENEQEAKEIAFQNVSDKDIESWEWLEQFNSGNVCHCPSPWEVMVEEVDSGE